MLGFAFFMLIAAMIEWTMLRIMEHTLRVTITLTRINAPGIAWKASGALDRVLALKYRNGRE